jgi:type I restriction enzyme M protein
MIFASYLIRLQVDKNKILSDYLFNFTKTQMYWNQVEVNSIAVTQPNLNAEKIEKEKENIKQLFSEAYNKADKNNILRLSDNNIFDISIGKRIIEANLSEKGKIPVYSANVFEPFGYIDQYLNTDFSIPSVLWGIDGWMVNYMPADKPFYPTN